MEMADQVQKTQHDKAIDWQSIFERVYWLAIHGPRSSVVFTIRCDRRPRRVALCQSLPCFLIDCTAVPPTSQTTRKITLPTLRSWATYSCAACAS